MATEPAPDGWPTWVGLGVEGKECMIVSNGESAITIRGVTKTFGKLRAVDDLTLDVPYGSLCGFLGPNGAGKTTTIRMIMAIIFPDSGELSVLGKASAVESKDLIGYLPEERGVYRKMKTTEYLVYMARLKGVDAGPAKRKASDWLDRVELPGVGKKRLEELSKGMQQKVQVAATLIHDPELVILDEPFSGLDPVNARMLRNLIVDMNKQEGRTIIFSTHVLPQAEQMCERIVMIDRGKTVLDGTLAEIRAQFDPRTLLVRKRSEDQRLDLRDYDGVQRVNEYNGEIEVFLNAEVDPVQVMRAMLNSDDLAKVELRQPSLDDIFISLVDDARLNEFGVLEVGSHD
ncbi:MAG: ATP-binding cassette domain-containing protein [Planctomycetes bacterium]|nr:ATP-binding cassette domain-containing protein [Planctomycetota bacterium]NOG55375.1 ATP-binding cassette domain-containing protein [Planctomycetota bacterium]